MAFLRSHHVLEHLSPHSHAPTFSDQASAIASRTVNEVVSLVRRSDAAVTCAANDTSGACAKPESSSTGNMVIIVAAVVPTVSALILLFFLHRRVRRKLRAEDANDPHKSLDFGMDHVGSASGIGGKKYPEMTVTDMDKSRRPGIPVRGLSMDLSSPYLLPAALQGSHDSLHSMSRSNDQDDPYRPVTFIKGDSDYSLRSTKSRTDNASVYTGSTEKSNENTRLVPNTARMSRTEATIPNTRSNAPKTMPPRGASLAQPTTQPDRWYPNDNDSRYGSESPPDLSATPATPQDLLSDRTMMQAFPQTLQRPLQPLAEPQYERQQYSMDFGNGQPSSREGLQITLPSPTHNRQDPPRSPAATSPHPLPIINEPPPVPAHQQNAGLDIPQDSRRVSVAGMRPLPPDDPTDNPEQRANRIRSFYKEYFDDSKPNPSGHYPQYDPYSDEYYGDVLDEGAIYDPETGAFVTNARPHTGPMTRGAMTPPTRGPAKFAGAHRSVASTQSAGRPAAPPKRIIPPKALQSLPTPHMLKNDTLTYSPIDFAPPTTFRDRQYGRAPDSPTGTSRPYSPAFRAHTPLVASFDDLAVMPSPHSLRKSGTYNALDFAPPGRFKFGDTGSDSGSIRSNRSGISAVQNQAIRTGAYRVSRLPKDMVGTSADFESTLKPTWDMRK